MLGLASYAVAMNFITWRLFLLVQHGHWLFIYGLVEKALEDLFCAKCAEQLAAVYYNYYDLDTWLCLTCSNSMTDKTHIQIYTEFTN